jgi:DNA repair exonuclease SbcCD ATPase subunit
MILKKLKIQNFRSFGNNINEIEFDVDKGNLILLVGKNGNGKSTISHALDYALYGEVKNNNKKLKLASLPNRFNNNLMVELDFYSMKSDVNVLRKINPSEFKVTIDNEVDKRAGKSNTQSKLDEYIEFDIDSWKSFISMSINDFKNFMSLKPEEKRLLLDRLFNLEMINDISKILKEKKKQFKYQVDLYDAEINSYDNSLSEFRDSIEKLKEAGKKNLEAEKIELKNSMLSKKEDFNKLQEKLKKCVEKDEELRLKLREIQDSASKVKYQIADTQDKLTLFNSGVCPTCGNNLSAETYNSYRDELGVKVTELESLKAQLTIEYNDITDKQRKLSQINTETNTLFNDLKYFLKSLKERIDAIDEKSDEDFVDIGTINQLNESITKIEDKKISSSDNLMKVKEEETIYDQMIKIFSNDGIKKAIISKIVVPINHFIKENLESLGMPFNIQLDDEFNARIETLGEEIDAETLSTGETKKANIAIMLAYLKLIRMKRYINILFLDEVFSSIDIDGIYDVLRMLKEFAHEYKINVFLIHHAMLEKSYFDKVLKIEKNVTSNIFYE